MSYYGRAALLHQTLLAEFRTDGGFTGSRPQIEDQGVTPTANIDGHIKAQEP